MASNQRVAVVTGSSSGIDHETSLTLARNGFLTYATMRSPDKGENIKSLAEKEKLPLKIVQMGLVQHETNLFGVIRVTQAVLISSGAGKIAIPVKSAYVSTKFAIEGVSESMAYELEPFGIKVVLVEPGFVKTNIGNNLVTAKKSQDANSPYSQLTEKMVSFIEHGLESGSPPDVVAKVVLKAVTSENPNLRYLAGKDVEKWMESKRGMPHEEFHETMKQNMQISEINVVKKHSNLSLNEF